MILSLIATTGVNEGLGLLLHGLGVLSLQVLLQLQLLLLFSLLVFQLFSLQTLVLG